MSTLRYTAACPACGKDCTWTVSAGLLGISSNALQRIDVNCRNCDAPKPVPVDQ